MNEQLMAELVAAGMAVVTKLDDPPNAPGHGHREIGIWDDDNPPELAGKPCQWCADWARFRAALTAAKAKQGAQ